MLNSRMNVAKTAFQIARGSAQSVNILNCDAGLLIHRVTVEVIADNQRIDVLEFREQIRKKPQPMHGTQRLTSMKQHQNLAEIVPQGKLAEFRGLCQRRLNAALSFATQL